MKATSTSAVFLVDNARLADRHGEWQAATDPSPAALMLTADNDDVDDEPALPASMTVRLDPLRAGMPTGVIIPVLAAPAVRLPRPPDLA